MKNILFFLLCGGCFLCVTGCVNRTTNEYIKDKIDIDISSCEIEDEQDSHGGFHGDGDYIVRANCSENSKNIIDQLNDWIELPLSENLQLIMYGGERDGITYSYDLAKQANIPQIDNGYYYFINRNRDAINKHSDDIFNEHSHNFTLAFYDKDNNMFYYYEYDT